MHSARNLWAGTDRSMKPIDVRDQPHLRLRRTLEICLNGVRYRLFRSLVTVVVIGVAVAFMMNVVSEAVSLRAIGDQAHQRTAEQRQAARWLARLSAVPTQEGLLRDAASAAPGSVRAAELQAIGGWSTTALSDYQQQARAAVRYLDFFSDAGYARRLLVRSSTGLAIFDRLQEAEHWQLFTEQYAKLPSLRFPGEIKDFQAFLRDWPTLQAQNARLQGQYGQAITRLQGRLAGRTLLDGLTDTAFAEDVRAAGFAAFDDATAAVVAEQAGSLRQQKLLVDGLQLQAIRQKLAANLNIMPGDITPPIFWRMLLKKSEAAWYLAQLRANDLETGNLRPNDVVQLARAQGEQVSLERAMQMTLEASGGLLGIGPRMTWLVLVSLLVCVVGIANAMLMSVTERFREIATLKCLGALDGFIMQLFLLEACMLGLVGGMMGAIAGSLIGFGRVGAAFGGLLFSAFPLGTWLAGFGMAVLMGMVLAAVAGVYPSYVAARLAPMEAMRIE